MKNEEENESKSLSSDSDVDSDAPVGFKNLQDSPGDPSSTPKKPRLKCPQCDKLL